MPDCRVAALCDPDPAALERAGRQLEGARLFPAYSEMLVAGIDLAVVASPVPAHQEQSQAALEAGCHVLQEVILAATVEECRQLLEVVRTHPRQKFMLAENCCYWAHILAWRQMWEQNMLGELVYAEAECIHDVRAGELPGQRPARGGARLALGARLTRLGLCFIVTGAHSVGRSMPWRASNNRSRGGASPRAASRSR
jgi:predicted dehydrogenase